ncbi:hypothetical protein TNIN_489441 [Trichonephila inaurata madagascariensis]|uniref:Uncharacterized protein n=1 Tax=Trichonephila inaurata madagascariensis TaxID=2747483 RepID=A0A8X6Y9G6_9ARAC|nr:hypothetical protein TNIN_489441 [Trichonephila inaurata madagascariensis]
MAGSKAKFCYSIPFSPVRNILNKIPPVQPIGMPDFDAMPESIDNLNAKALPECTKGEVDVHPPGTPVLRISSVAATSVKLEWTAPDSTPIQGKR